MALPRLPLAWNWSGVKTDTDDRSLQIGELTSLVNVRRTVEGRLQKRPGNDRTAITQPDLDLLPGPAKDIVPSDVLIVRDPDDQIYAVDAENVAHDRGLDRRAHPTWVQVENLHAQGGVHKPLLVESEGRLYHMVLGVGAGGLHIQVSVYDVDGLLLAPPANIAATDIVAFSATADANGDVWLAYVRQNTSINTRKLDSNGAVSASALITVAATEFQDVKLRRMPNGEVLLAAISVDTAGANHTVKRYHAYLDTSTGGAAVSPAPVTATVTVGPLNPNITCGPGLGIANSADDTSLYFLHFWAAATTTSLLLKRVQINPTTFAEIESTVRTVTVSAATDEGWMGATAAFHLAGVVTVFSSLNRVDATDGPIETRTSVVVKSVSGVDTTVARSAYLAGDDVFKVGSVRYILTGFDDMVDEDTPGTQRGYFIRDTTGRIVTSILDGVGGMIFYNGCPLEDWEAPCQGHTVSPVVSGTTVYLPLLTVGGAETIHEPILTTVDFDPTWHSIAADIVPGGVPKYVSKDDEITELAPIHYPYVDPEITSDGPGVDWSRNRVAYRYVTIDANGRRVPSAPRPTVELQFHEYMSPSDLYFVRVATLRHTVGNVWIELFMSDDQDSGDHPTAGTELYLARRLPNFPDVDYVDFPIGPRAFVAGSGELLDTTNLEARLENGSVPPARLAAILARPHVPGRHPGGRRRLFAGAAERARLRVQRGAQHRVARRQRAGNRDLSAQLRRLRALPRGRDWVDCRAGARARRRLELHGADDQLPEGHQQSQGRRPWTAGCLLHQPRRAAERDHHRRRNRRDRPGLRGLHGAGANRSVARRGAEGHALVHGERQAAEARLRAPAAQPEGRGVDPARGAMDGGRQFQPASGGRSVGHRRRGRDGRGRDGLHRLVEGRGQL